jgi:Nuclease-related domain/AAA domain
VRDDDLLSGGNVSAGESARVEADASARLATELRQAAEAAERRSRNFAKGGVAEARVGQMLGALGSYEIHTLHDRRWPGTRSANIDHIVVGASGVFVVDTKDWSEHVRVEGDHLWRGQASCDDDLDKARRMADAICAELVEEGLAPNHVVAVLAFSGQSLRPTEIRGVWIVGAEELPRFILVRGKLFTQLQIERLLTRLIASCPPATASPVVAIPLNSVADATVNAKAEQTALIDQVDLDDAALDAAMRAPLADWMTFLHPDQARLVRRSLNGPARISGPAGTGKSVVALHRLAYLAQRRSGRLLYVTFVKTVPRVLSQAYTRLSPNTVDRVEFTNLHSWAFRHARSRGLVRTIDQAGIDQAFDGAWAKTRQPLEKSATVHYWREEIDRVVRGRTLRSLDSYLDLERIGRGSRLGSAQRRAVWDLLEAYESELSRRGLVDWNDVLRITRDEVRRRPIDPSYDVVVLDEAQDMPLVAAELLHAIVGDRADGLLLVGDDQQRVFSGGFRLVEAGIDVTGRSTRLIYNYRNTREILEAARAVLTNDDDDLLEGVKWADSFEVSRSGETPQIDALDTRAAVDAALVERLRLVLERPFIRPGEVAVLVESRRDVRRYIAHLEGVQIRAAALTDWDGLEPDSVIVGTGKSAKGLEFKAVLLPNVDPSLMRGAPPGDDYLAEAWLMRKRELYVAMTRARDTLWLGYVLPIGA